MQVEQKSRIGFKSILLLLAEEGNHEAALECAARLAQQSEARLKILELRPRPPRWLLRVAGRGRLAPVERLVMEHRRAELQGQLADMLELCHALRVEITISQATLADALARELRGFGPELIVAATPGSGRIGRQLRDLLRRSPVPVWTIGSQATEGVRRVLAGVGTSLSQTAEALDREVLEFARAIALAEGAELDVVHAWLPYGLQLIRNRGATAVAHAAQHARLVNADHRRALRQTLSGVDMSGVRLRSHLVEGETDRVIVELAELRQSDLIVVGSIGRAGLSGALIGNTSETVVAQAQRSVLTVKANAARSFELRSARAFEPMGGGEAGELIEQQSTLI